MDENPNGDKWECPGCGGTTESAFERCDDCICESKPKQVSVSRWWCDPFVFEIRFGKANGQQSDES